MMSVDTANSTSRASPASTSGITISRNKPVSGFTTTAPLDRSKGGHASTVLGTGSSAGLGSPLTTAPSASAGGVAGDKDGESSAKIVSAMINPGEGQGTPGPNSSVPAASARAGSHGNGTGSGSGKGWASGYSTPEAGLGDFKRKRDQAAQAHAQQPLRAPVNPANYEYSSDEMEEDMADDDSDEDIEREPLPGENIFSRIRGGSEEEEEDGTVLVQRRAAGHGAGDEVDELESVNGDGAEPGKLGQVKKIKLVLNNGKSKAGKMVVGPDGKARKRSVSEWSRLFFLSCSFSRLKSREVESGERSNGVRSWGRRGYRGGAFALIRRTVSKEVRGVAKGDRKWGERSAWHISQDDQMRVSGNRAVERSSFTWTKHADKNTSLHYLSDFLSSLRSTHSFVNTPMLAVRNPLDIFISNYSTTLKSASSAGKRLTAPASAFDAPPHRPRPRRYDSLPALRTSKLIERVKRGSSKPTRRARSVFGLGANLWDLDTSDAVLRNRRGRSWPLIKRTPSPLSRSIDDADTDLNNDNDVDPETLALDDSDENRAVKRRKVGADGASEGSVPPKDKIKAGLIDGELKVPGPRRTSGGNKRADRPRRPPPLEMSSGNRELPPPSAGMMSSMRNTGMVSPVVSGFPLHQADKVTREAFRNSMAIKDAQRSLIQQRKEGAIPPASDLPGGGPPPSAGPLPTLLTYIPTSGEGTGSFSERRGDDVKNKVKGMKLNTGDMSSVRDGLRTAPSGKFDGQSGDEAEDDDEYDAREAAGYDAEGNSYYEMEKKQRAEEAAAAASGDPSVNARGQPRTAYPALGSSLQAQQKGKGPSNRGLPSSLHIPPYSQRTASQQHPGPPGHPADGNGPVPDTAGGRPPPGMMPHPGYYPYPGPPPGHPMAGPPGRGMPGMPPGYHPGQYDRERDAFMSHFAKFYDALLDSTQLRADLATKIHKANELVGAHQIELRKVENLRQQYEAALADLKARTDKVLGPGEPKAGGSGTSDAGGAAAAGSTRPKSSTGPAGDVEMASS